MPREIPNLRSETAVIDGVRWHGTENDQPPSTAKGTAVTLSALLTKRLGALVVWGIKRQQQMNTDQRSNNMADRKPQYPPLPPDDPKRYLTLADADTDQTLPHIGLVGDTYTITLSGKDTDGRFCVIDMHIPPEGGPAPHRHDFEETFILLEGEIEATFRGKKSIVRAGDTVNIPANAPHQFHNTSSKAVRLLCICSPAGQEDFFKEVGIPVATRTTPPPKLDAKQQAEFMKKAQELASKYRTELLKEA